MHALENWCKKWFVALNPLKSQLVIFTKCPRHKKELEDYQPTLKMFGENVPIVAEATYLGIIFDSRLTWEPQFRKMTTRAYQRWNLLRYLSSLSQKPNPNTMIHLYRSIIRPIFEYGSVCIINAAEQHLGKIQLVQNQALRIITKSPRYMTSMTALERLLSRTILYQMPNIDFKL